MAYLEVCVLEDFTACETGHLPYRGQIHIRVIEQKEVHTNTCLHAILTQVIVNTVLGS